MGIPIKVFGVIQRQTFANATNQLPQNGTRRVIVVKSENSVTNVKMTMIVQHLETLSMGDTLMAVVGVYLAVAVVVVHLKQQFSPTSTRKIHSI